MSNSGSGGGWLVAIVVGLAVWYFFAYRGSDSDAKYHVTSTYHIPVSKVQIEGAQPHDCDFWTAPLGAKHCHYEREYLVQWYMLSPVGAHHPIEYATMQEHPPRQCWQPDPACQEIDDLQPDEHPGVFFGWQARRAEIRWRKVEE